MFRRITVPLLAPVLTVVLITMLINVLKVFDIVISIAPGSVQDDANVIALQMWRTSLRRRERLRPRSAIAVFIFLLVIPILASTSAASGGRPDDCGPPRCELPRPSAEESDARGSRAALGKAPVQILLRPRRAVLARADLRAAVLVARRRPTINAASGWWRVFTEPSLAAHVRELPSPVRERHDHARLF